MARRLEIVPAGRDPRGLKVVAGELLVRPAGSMSHAGMQALADRLGSRIRGYGAHSRLYRLEVPAGMEARAFAAALRESGQVQEALSHAVMEGASCPSGDYRPRQWNLDRMQEAAACASFAEGLSTVRVAVLDTGAAYEDRSDATGTYREVPDLAQVEIVPGYDFVNDDPHPNDDHQHGTHIAGIIAAEGRAAGVAPSIELMPVKVLDADKLGTELSLVEGIHYAVDQGADVINMSLSFGEGYIPSPALQEAVAYAAEHGVVMVASSGNHGAREVSYPAAFPDVIAVGASRIGREDRNAAPVDYHAYYSNRGWALDLVAPGGMLNTDMNDDDLPDAALAQAFDPESPDEPGYWLIAGTSQAAAHVSGAAAWLLADGVAADEVGSILRGSADPMRLSEHDAYVGAGQLQLQAARDLAEGGPPAASSWYVNLLPSLHRGANGGTRAEVRVQVMDGQGRPAAGVRVGGAWMGSYTDGNAVATTDADGVVRLSSSEMSGSSGVAVGFRVDAVWAPGQRAAEAPVQFYSLTPASAEVYARLLNDATLRESMLLFKLDPADAALDAVVERSSLEPSFVMKPVGSALRLGPLVVVFDEAFAPELADPAEGTATPVAWEFAHPLFSGRGPVTMVSGQRIDATAEHLGPVSRFLILPLDPAMARLGPEHGYPVLNALPARFLEDNRVFGNGFAASAVGSGFAASAVGSGFASSTLGDGYASASLGDGFASSTLGSGFAASAVGSGFAASAVGSGFAASTVGSGFAASAVGSGFAASAVGSGFAASTVGSGEEGAVMEGMGGLLSSLLKTTTSVVTSTTSTVTSTVTSTTSTLTGTTSTLGTTTTGVVTATTGTVTATTNVLLCTVTALLPALGGIALDDLSSCTRYIETEEELEAWLGAPHYPR